MSIIAVTDITFAVHSNLMKFLSHNLEIYPFNCTVLGIAMRNASVLLLSFFLIHIHVKFVKEHNYLAQVS
jgi:hypothetical protein